MRRERPPTPRTGAPITKQQVIPLLLEACPWFAPTWQEFAEHWKNDRDPPLYTVLGDFGHALVRMVARREEKHLPAACAAIERLHCEGDAWVREAATIGILEAIQNVAGHEKLPQKDFRARLGPESARAWDQLNRDWAQVGKKPRARKR